MFASLLLATAMMGQYPSGFSYQWWYQPMPPPVRPHTIEIRSGREAWVKEFLPQHKRIVAELPDGEVVWFVYGHRTRIYGRLEPGAHIWVDSFRHTVTVLPDDQIPPMILEERR